MITETIFKDCSTKQKGTLIKHFAVHLAQCQMGPITCDLYALDGMLIEVRHTRILFWKRIRQIEVISGSTDPFMPYLEDIQLNLNA